MSDNLHISVEMARNAEKIAKTWGYAGLANAIAIGMIEERKRCAEIADTVQPVETHNSYFHEGWDAASMTIASAIMGEEK